METVSLPPAARAFDAVAEQFDERFGAWASVAAQRRAVRSALADAFAVGTRVLEIGGGTGEDAMWLAQRGRNVLLTDPSPSMVRIAHAKLRPLGCAAPLVASAEQLTAIQASIGAPLDGAFSNFAGLNCVTDLTPVGQGLAAIVRPGGSVLLVVFGVCSPGEWLVQLLRGESRTMFRRMHRGDVHARLGGQEFVVRYHRRRDLVAAFDPWFRLVSRRGVGVLVPPSAAEPWISRHPRLLGVLEQLDKAASGPLAMFGDHVLYHFTRTAVDAPERSV